MAKRLSETCQWIGRREALRLFVDPEVVTQGQQHIRPLHWYVASRLVLEGGFYPDDITPRPPFSVSIRGERRILDYDESAAGSGELDVFGGLKTKQVDVTVCKNGIGPVMAVSMKGTRNAFRNLTNRMEEAVGDCTNLHISYPALVYGFLQVMRATRQAQDNNDIAIGTDGMVVDSIKRYHDVLSRLTGRNDVRADPTMYEAVSLSLVEPGEAHGGDLFPSFPPDESPLAMNGFFARLYEQYDQRFVFAAPSLKKVTRRAEWTLGESIANDPRIAEFDPRVVE